MAKSVPLHLVTNAGKCIFCGRPGLSKTHIWPDWLNSLLLPGNARLEELDRPDHDIGSKPILKRHSKMKQGSIFTQKPYLACVDCNTGWMKAFEDEMNKFAKPLFTSYGAVKLNHTQLRIFAIWTSLVTILSEYIDKSTLSITISKDEREYLKKYRKPPEHWSIFAVSSSGTKWKARYRHNTSFIGDFENLIEYHAAIREKRRPNTQISSFGMGKLFVQVFTCHNLRLVHGFRLSTKTAGLIQIWPLPGFWPFTKGSAKFPTKLVLKDDEADEIADAYNERIKILTVTPDKV